MKTNVRPNSPYIVYDDIFEFINNNTSTDIIVPHIVNNVGSFDSGFATAVARNYPIVKANYELMGVYKLGENQVIKIDQALTTNPNVGGFGQTETEIVLQDPARIYGFLAFCVSVIITQSMFVFKKKQFEKVQIAELDF